MTEENWKWYSGDNDESYSYGPFDNREEAIDEARGGYGDDVGIFVIAAIKGEIRLRDYIGASHILEEAEERAYDMRNPDGDNNIFDVTREQEKDLAVMLKTACDAWQIKHGLRFAPWFFTATRNEEFISPEAERD